jgi:hypothetical protein
VEILQGNSLCSYLYQKQEKMSFSTFFISSFSSTTSEDGGTGPGRGSWYQWEEGDGRERG